MELQLDATITVLLISKISSTWLGQSFAHLQERKTETFTTYGTMSCYVVGRVSERVAWHYVYVCACHITGHCTICCKSLSLALLKMGKSLPETC
jgi:hypothetical protein